MRDAKERKAEICKARTVYIVKLLACCLQNVTFQFSMDSVVTSSCHIGNLGSVVTTAKGNLSCNLTYAVQTQRRFMQACQPSATPDVLTTTDFRPIGCDTV